MNSHFCANSEWKKPENLKKLRSRNAAAALQVPNFAEMHGVDGDCEEVSSSARDNIHVLVRIRPKSDLEKDKDSRTVIKALDPHTLIFDPKQETVEFFFHGVKQKVYDYKTRPNKNLSFAFDQVFSPTQSNVEIFDAALKPLINHVIRGFNCSVFAYGATGSGKTYTMLGSAGNPGLTFLMAKELSKRINEMANEYESEIVISYLEVYNETIKDLLHPSSGQLSIREDGLNGINVPDLTLHKIKDTSDLLRMLSHGNKARTQHPTDHNSESSRSHAVFQIFVSLRKRITHLSLNYKTAKAKLVMVDLAGSERGSTNNSDCQRCREGGSINKSLLALANCINSLADGKKHIPYRDSKLTRLLKDSLGGNCKTVMIANVAPTTLNYDDTYNTLKYADRAKKIRVSLKRNVVSIEEPDYEHYGKMIGDLQSEINQLKLVLETEREASNSLLEQERTRRRAPPLPLDSGGFASQNISLPPVIHDPAVLENFIQLLGQKKKLEEGHVEASINARESQWRLMWQKWRIDSAKALSRGDNEVSSEQGGLEELKSHYKNLRGEQERCQEKVGLAKRLVDFNDKEIDLIQKTFPDFSEEDDPFLTVTLREFLNYKTLEREVGTHKCIENFHQQMCSGMLDELLRTEIILSDNLKFSKYLHGMLEKHGIPVRPPPARHRQALVSKIYGGNKESGTTNSERKRKRRRRNKDGYPWQESVENMIQLIKNPIVEYESTPGTAEHHSCRNRDESNESPHRILKVTHGDGDWISNGTRGYAYSNLRDIFESSPSSNSESESESESELENYVPSGVADFRSYNNDDVESNNQRGGFKMENPSIELRSSRASTVCNIVPRYHHSLPQTDTSFGQSSETLSGKISERKQPRPPPSPAQSPFRSRQNEKRHSNPSSCERKSGREKGKRKPISLLGGKEERRSDYVTEANYSGSFDRGGEQQAQSPEKKNRTQEEEEDGRVTTFKDPKQKDPNPIDAQLPDETAFQMRSPRSQKSAIGLDGNKQPKLKKRSSRKEKQKKSTCHDQVSFSKPSHPQHDPLSHTLESKNNANGPGTLVPVPKERQKSSQPFESSKLSPSPAHPKVELSPVSTTTVKACQGSLNLTVSPANSRKYDSDSETPQTLGRPVQSFMESESSPTKLKTDFASTQMFARPSPVPTVSVSKTVLPKGALGKVVTEPEQASSKMSQVTSQNQKFEKDPPPPVVNKLVKEDGKQNQWKSKDFGKEKPEEIPNLSKGDSKEDFWTNGMFLPSPPESYASSEHGGFPQPYPDLNPSKFNFPKEEKHSMAEQTRAFHHFKSNKDQGGATGRSPNICQTFPSPAPQIEFSPRSSNWETFHEDAEPPLVSLTKTFKYTTTGSGPLPNLTPQRHFCHPRDDAHLGKPFKPVTDYDNTHWRGIGDKTTCGPDFYGGGGKGDARFRDNDNFDIKFMKGQEGHGDHEHLIVKPPPGYEKPKDETSYFTRLLSFPNDDFNSF